MEGSTYWISVNALGDESVHQYEPTYNELYDSWRCCNVTVNIHRGYILTMVNINFDISLLEAYALEVSCSKTTNKLIPINCIKLYKK